MKTTTPQLASHMAQENTTLARLLKIVRLDGTILRFTDFDTDMQYNDGSGLPIIASAWFPIASGVAPWWVQTDDTFSLQSFAGNTGNSYFRYFPASAPWAESEMFSGFSGTTADFIGTVSYLNGFTFQTVCSLHADTLNYAGPGSVGGIRTGVSTGAAWASTDKYIGFEGYKNAGVTWGNWMLRMSDGTTTTLIDSGVAIGDAIDPAGYPTITGGVRTTLSFTVAADGSLVTWYINGTSVGGATTGIPTTPMPLSNHFESLSFAGSVYYQVESLEILIPEVTIGTYASGDCVTFTAVTNKDDGSPNNMQVSGFLSSAGITEADVRARLYDGATFQQRVVNWQDLTMLDAKMLAGTIGDYEFKNGLFTVELRGLTQKLTTVIGSLYGPLCRAELFGGGTTLVNGLPIDSGNHWQCRLNQADWVQNGSVQASPDSITIVPYNEPSVSTLVMRGSATPTVSAPAGWFNDGIIVFTSGALSGYTFEIANWDGTTLSLFGGAPMPFSPQPGDTFQIEPGCDKTKQTCYAKFNNIINHAGEADIPGLNVIGAVSRTQITS